MVALLSRQRAIGLILVLVLCVASAFAAPPPKNINPKDVADFAVVIDNVTTPQRLIPGKSVPFDVVIRDKKGQTYSLSAGTLAARDLRVTPSLMHYDAVAHTVTGESDRAAAAGKVYAIHVEYGPVGKSPLQVDRAFKADFAALYGPEPDQVQALHGQILGTADPRALVPGQPVSVRISAIDADGREYATDGKPFPLPLDRLVLGGQLVQWRSDQMMFIPVADRTAAKGKSYQISVAYKGAPLVFKREYGADFAAVEGPDPQDVASLDFALAGVGEGGKIAPGLKTTYDVVVTDKSGRRYSLRGGTPKLPASRIRFTAENATVDADAATVETSADAKKMLNKQYTFSVSYVGLDNPVRSRSYEPDFASLLEPFMFKGTSIVLNGTDGEGGDAGADGEAGKPGTATSQQYGTGGPGGRGGQGRDGRAGRRGGRGPRVKIVASSATTIDGDTRLLVFEVTTPGKDPAYFVRPLDSKPIQIVSIGGRGGAGGIGGAGGHGGKGGQGYNTGDGGDGGNAGNGGAGGQGGQGGDIQLIVASPDLAGSFELVSRGGPGGPAGAAGSRGSAGTPGAPVQAIATAVGGLIGALAGGKAAAPPPTAELGHMGAMGDNGMQGDPGNEGEPGQTNVQTGGEALALSRKIAAIPKLAGALLLPEPAAKSIQQNQ